MRILILAALPLLAAAPSAPFLVGTHGYATLQAAVDAIGDGEGVVTLRPGTYRECAVQQAGRVTFRAATPGTAILDGAACEDKAGLVLRGRGTVVEGIVFRGYRVADGNGAGIRTEAGDLTVREAMFLDSQQGIGGGYAGPQTVTIDHATFAGLGQCDEAVNCSHAIYLGNRGTVTITRSRFERGTGGHYVKLRVPVVRIADNSFDDTAGRGTNYMIDLPEGATGAITGNVFVQGAHKENGTTLIAVAAEARTYPSAGLRIEGNTASLAPGQKTTPALVGDWSHARLAIGANRLTGVTPFAAR